MCLDVLCTTVTLSSCCFLYVLGCVVYYTLTLSSGSFLYVLGVDAYYCHSFVVLFLLCAWRCCVLLSLFRRVVSCMCLEVLCTTVTLSSCSFLYVLGGVVYYCHSFVV